jgi:DNA gyrase/topoisomerase IV subunit A
LNFRVLAHVAEEVTLTAFYSIQEKPSAVLDLTNAELPEELAQLESRLHVLRGQLDALSRVDDLNQVIQFSMTREAALEALRHAPFRYSEEQAAAILDMPMSSQSVEGAQLLRQEYERLTARRASSREQVTEVLALHWFG